MKRREFLKLAGLAGASGTLPLYPGADLFASHPGDYSGPLYLLVDANGGWDPTSLCDPKGFDQSDPFPRVNNYLRTDIQDIRDANGNLLSDIRYAPPPPMYMPGGTNYVGNEDLEFIARDFFTKHYPRLLVINGVDSRTTSHNSGRRHNWSGELGTRGYPSFAAMVAGLGGPASNKRPLSFITNGGYDETAGLVAPVRLDSEGMRALFEVAYPNRSVVDNPARVYFPEGTGQALELIQNARVAREVEMLATSGNGQLRQRLPRLRTAINRWIGARQGGHMAALANDLQQNPAPTQAQLGIRGRAYDLYEQGRLALAGYQQGVTCAALLRAGGGFDTHSDHDRRHYPRLMSLIQGVDAIWEEARARGLENRLVIVMASDFGRTNKYNNGNGKDHWPITSWMIMGNDSPGGAIAGTSGGIAGNRVIGDTTDQHGRIETNPGTLRGARPGDVGVRMTPAHVHWNLRQLANIDPGTITSLRLDVDSNGELDFFN